MPFDAIGAALDGVLTGSIPVWNNLVRIQTKGLTFTIECVILGSQLRRWVMGIKVKYCGQVEIKRVPKNISIFEIPEEDFPILYNESSLYLIDCAADEMVYILISSGDNEDGEDYEVYSFKEEDGTYNDHAEFMDMNPDKIKRNVNLKISVW